MPSRRAPLDPYAVLGLQPGATRTDVRRAYRRLAMALHPDVAGADATAGMSRLNQARDELLARLPSRGRTAPPNPADPATASQPKPARPRRRPAGTEGHEAAWPDHWSAWNDLPRRDR